MSLWDSPLRPVADDQSQRKAVFTDKAVKPPLKSGEWNSITLSYAPAEREFADLFFYMNAGETVEVSWKPDLEFYGKMPAKK